jgi:uncharacterized protein (DUF4415 family)
VGGYIKNEDIDYSDIPQLDDEFWSTAKLIIPERKKSISFRIDQEILDFFKAYGRGYQTRINSVLKTYVRGVKKEVQKAGQRKQNK